MDLTAVETVRAARSRADLALAPGEHFLAGGTWLYSERQPDVTGLVDLSPLGWDELDLTASGDLRIGAMATIAALEAWARSSSLAAAPLFGACAESLLASFKVRAAATVGGNIARSYAAAAMTALAVTLDARATLWTADGEREVPVAAIPAGDGEATLRPGEALRAILIPASALRSRTAHRRIALNEHGRSGALVTGRRDGDGAVTVVVTAATQTPWVLHYSSPPAAATVESDVRAASGFYTDPLGSADWRRQVSAVLAAQVVEDLS